MTRRPRVLLVTEGTYPFVLGGVSVWCDLLVRRLAFDWRVLAIVAADAPREPFIRLPAHARLARRVEVWSDDPPPFAIARPTSSDVAIPALLARHLIGLDGDPRELQSILVMCRERRTQLRGVFRSRTAWEAFRAEIAVMSATTSRASDAAGLADDDAALVYQALYWVARVAAVVAPACDVVLASAAGWSAIPGIVEKAVRGVPLVVAEHGVFLREAYLGVVGPGARPGERFLMVRLARGLTRAAYAHADVVAPVSEANARWERELGVDERRIRVIPNGSRSMRAPVPAPRTRTVVSVCRIDPLKDIRTLLLAAAEVVRRMPDAQFTHYGPVGTGAEAYARACTDLHRRLGLGKSFRFLGPTSDAPGVMAAADVAVLSSISEGMPLAALEAMAQARPVVATAVGGVPETIGGAGIVTPSGDVSALADALCALLGSPALAERLGRRGYQRVQDQFAEERCLAVYDELLTGLAASRAA